MEYTLEMVINCERNILADIERHGIDGGKDTHSAILALLEELKAYRETGCTVGQVQELSKRGWMPYPDNVPLNGQEVLVQLKNEHVCVATFDAEEPAAFIDDNRNFIDGYRVVAWMPMPERYKGEKR